MGGMKAIHLAARQGFADAVEALVAGGANIDEPNSGDQTTPLLIATINGHYDLAKLLLEKGANPKLASSAGATPLYTTINVKWAPKADYPQPDAPRLQKTSYLDLMQALIAKGADVNAQLKKELWFTGYNFDLSQVNAAGATPFWRAAQAGDVPAMRVLLAAGADPKIKTTEGTSPLHVAAGAGVHGNDEVTAPGGWMAGLKYIVDELELDVNELDGQGMTAMHHAAARGDNEMILFLVSKGGRVDVVGKNGQTTVDLANGPRQRIQPFPETIALLMSLGAKNNYKCVSC
jgi:ankyrin repeat protein